MTPPPPLTSFSLTHVQYNANDKLGFLAAGLSLAPVFLIVAYVTATLARRDLYLFTGLVGQILNTILNVVIKRIIRQPRPILNHSIPDAVGFSPHGMPSNHSQFVFFFVGFWLPWIFTNRNNISRTRITSNGGSGCVCYRYLAAFVIVVCAFAVLAARVYLNYHTIAQVGVGAVVGILVGSVWHWVTCTWIVPIVFPWVTSLSIASSLGITDLTHIQDIVAFEHAIATTTDPDTWQELLKWRQEGEPLTSASFSPNQNVLLKPSIVKQLFIFPIKSCSGISIQQAQVTPSGLKASHRNVDRAWAIVRSITKESLTRAVLYQNESATTNTKSSLYEPITIRTDPKMVLIQPSFENEDSGEMRITLPDGTFIKAPVLTKSTESRSRVLVWNTICAGHDQGDAVGDFLTKYLNSSKPLRLIHMGDDDARALQPCAKYGTLATKDMISRFSDWSTYNILSQQSVDKINDHLPNDTFKIDSETYRSNILIDSPCAFWEDGLEVCSIGIDGVNIVFSKNCGRCILPTINIHTGIRSKDLEPLKTLRKYRAGHYSHIKDTTSPFFGPQPFLGINCNFGKNEGTIRVGDVVQPLEIREEIFQPMLGSKNPFGKKYF